LRATFEAAGVEFTNSDKPGVRLLLVSLRSRNYELRRRVDEAYRLAPESVQNEIDAIAKDAEYAGLDDAASLQEAYRNLRRRQRALEATGVEFIDEPPGVRLKETFRRATMPNEIRLDDYVMFPDDRPPPDIRSVGFVGQ